MAVEAAVGGRLLGVCSLAEVDELPEDLLLLGRELADLIHRAVVAHAVGREHVVAHQIRRVGELLGLKHEAVQHAGLHRILHLQRCICHEGNVGLELHEFGGGSLAQGVGGVIGVQQRHQEVGAGGAGEGVCVAHGQLPGGGGLGHTLYADRAVLGDDLGLFGLGERDAGHVARKPLFHQRHRHALGLQVVAPQLVGGRKGVGQMFSRGDVVAPQARGDAADGHRYRLAAHGCAGAVEAVGHVHQPAVLARAGLFRGGEDLYIVRRVRGHLLRVFGNVRQRVLHIRRGQVHGLLDGGQRAHLHAPVQAAHGLHGLLLGDLVAVFAHVLRKADDGKRAAEHDQRQRGDQQKRPRFLVHGGFLSSFRFAVIQQTHYRYHLVSAIRLSSSFMAGICSSSPTSMLLNLEISSSSRSSRSRISSLSSTAWSTKSMYCL